MKFFATLALIAGTQAVALKTKSAVKAEGDVSITIAQSDLMNIMTEI